MDLPDQVKALLINGEVIATVPLFYLFETVPCQVIAFLDLPSCIWNTLYVANQDSSIGRLPLFLILI